MDWEKQLRLTEGELDAANADIARLKEKQFTWQIYKDIMAENEKLVRSLKVKDKVIEQMREGIHQLRVEYDEHYKGDRA